jgi:hypothetical protein
VFVGRQDVVELGPERPLGNLRQAVEDPEDLILAHVVAGEEVPSGDVEGDVVGKQLLDGVPISTAEGVVCLPDEILVRMGYGLFLPLVLG